MNREIKFRMWNEEAKKYHYDVENVFNCIAQQNVHDGIMETRGFTAGYDHISEGSVFEQYVGKVGANAVEVWEGDRVIARMNHHGRPLSIEISAFISYNHHVGTWQIQYENAFGNLVSDDIGFKYFLEVIGNIHQEREVSNG